MLIYDVGDRDSFNNVEVWLKEIEKHAPDNACLILVGNKCDIPDRKISESEGKELASRYNMRFIEMSAKKGINVSDAFVNLSNDIINRIPFYKKKESFQQTRIKVDSKKKAAKKKCCAQ